MRCLEEHSGEFGSGKYCSRKCSNSRSWTEKDKKKKQNTINKKLFSGGTKLCDYGCKKYSNFRLPNGKYCCSEHHNSCESLRKRNSSGVKQCYTEGRIGKITELALANSRLSREDNLLNQFEANINEILSYGSNVKNDRIKKYLVKLKIWEYECSDCKIYEWNNKPISLELDHINGDNKDNRLENIRLMCPNCHSQTPTFRRKKSSLKLM